MLTPANCAVIDACFSQPTAEEILEALDAHGSSFAAETLATLERQSPTSIKVTMEAVARHAPPDVTITEALVTEYRLSQRFMQPQPASDFREGIRAVLVDKPVQAPPP